MVTNLRSTTLQAVRDYNASQPLVHGQSADDQLLSIDSLQRANSDMHNEGSGTKTSKKITFGNNDEHSSSEISKRAHQRMEAMVKTLFDSTVPPTVIRECFQVCVCVCVCV